MNGIDGQILYASFNYSPPPLIVYLIGVSAALVILGVLSLTKSVTAGLFGGGLACAAIGVFIASQGEGDMTGISELFYGVIGAFAGAVGGASWAYIRKQRMKTPPVPYINSDTS